VVNLLDHELIPINRRYNNVVAPYWAL